MMGSALIAFIGGIFYWWPKMTGRCTNDLLGRIAAVIIFIGFNGTFFPQFVMGSKGMPRRYYNLCWVSAITTKLQLTVRISWLVVLYSLASLLFNHWYVAEKLHQIHGEEQRWSGRQLLHHQRRTSITTPVIDDIRITMNAKPTWVQTKAGRMSTLPWMGWQYCSPGWSFPVLTTVNNNKH